jgi:hypothetical protein
MAIAIQRFFDNTAYLLLLLCVFIFDMFFRFYGPLFKTTTYFKNRSANFTLKLGTWSQN